MKTNTNMANADEVIFSGTPGESRRPSTTAALAGSALTTVEVKFNAGFGNSVFLRGNGGGLNWERGIPLVCVDGETWRWSGTIQEPIVFKPLINDRVWATGSDLKIKPGQKLEVRPTFGWPALIIPAVREPCSIPASTSK